MNKQTNKHTLTTPALLVSYSDTGHTTILPRSTSTRAEGHTIGHKICSAAAQSLQDYLQGSQGGAWVRTRGLSSTHAKALQLLYAYASLPRRRSSDYRPAPPTRPSHPRRLGSDLVAAPAPPQALQSLHGRRCWPANSRAQRVPATSRQVAARPFFTSPPEAGVFGEMSMLSIFGNCSACDRSSRSRLPPVTQRPTPLLRERFFSRRSRSK